MARFTDLFLDVTKDGHKIPKENYLPQGKYPIIDQGQEYIAGYSDEAEGLYEDVPAIIFGDHTRIIKYVDRPCFLGADGVKLLKAKDSNSNYKYLYYALCHAKIPNTGYNRHFKWLKEVDIRLPNKHEQQNVVGVLDQLTGLISLRKQQLAKLDELVKARFVEMFGDLADPYCKFKKCTLAETCLDADDIKCGPFGTQLSKDEYQNEGIAVWEIPQINNGFTSKPTHFLTIEKAEQLKAYSIEPGDIAMSRKGNVGKCRVFPDYYEPGIIHSDVLRIRVDSKRVIPCFMMYQLHFSRAVQYQIETVSSGAIMAGINVTKLKQIEVYVPEYELQQRFSGFVGKVDRQKLTIQQSLDKLEVLRKSLMQEYFG